ncbi:MAG: YceI family protein [Anaerolineales bacterium]|nr:YceI family protein [Anaerolineales bacterium]MDW8161899.1 YceI family protein [Anaerolineales bacterium]
MRTKTALLLLLGIVIFALAGYAAYQFVLGPTLPPSNLATPIPVETAIQSQTSTEEPLAYPGPTEDQAAPATNPETLPSPYPAPQQATPESPANVEGSSVFQILSEESVARFTIYEELRGSPKDVIGETNLVSGEILVNPSDLSQSKVGVIQINARGFITDDERRNSAIRNRILQTDAYEYILFTPTSIEGLSGSGEVGKTYTFRLTGDLTIRNVTQPVTFEVTVNAESTTRLRGNAKATIRRSDFNLVVPNVPFVANVADEVKLELIFVAAAK